MLAGACGARFRESPRARKILNWLAGSVFAGLAVKLVLAER
jgi:threonine/homoserine/homoserine lactone efflux protein